MEGEGEEMAEVFLYSRGPSWGPEQSMAEVYMSTLPNEDKPGVGPGSGVRRICPQEHMQW